jgi:hypothetical protein
LEEVKEIKMNICPERKDKLFLDVYGEMDAGQRSAWEDHLAKCEACRLEKEKLLELLQASKQSGLSPDLFPEETQALSASIIRKLRNDKLDHWWEWVFMANRRLTPSMAAACILLLFLGWFGLNNFNSSDKAAKTSQIVLDEKIMISDEELLENMEMLQELEALEKLVNLLDIQNQGAYLQESEGKTNHGTALV